MTALRITDTKRFMELLLTGEAFDSFLFVSADVSMAMDHHISGNINKSFLSETEKEIVGERGYHFWAAARENVMHVVRGKRLPLKMKIILMTPGKSPENARLFSIRFENNELSVITGLSRGIYVSDREEEKEWAGEAESFLKEKGIAFENY